MYTILSLDGGGIRGLLTATILERLTAAAPGWLDKVDCFAGTSTGGILALGLAHGMTPTQLKALYYDNGKDIFDASWIHEIESLDGAVGAKYANDKLKALLAKTFGEKTLGQLAKKVVIPTFDLNACVQGRACWAPHFMHNFGGPDNNIPMVQAALRTSAAPVYFPSVGSFIDGGVIANDPAMVALGRVLDKANAPNPKLEEVSLLSLGTGVATNSVTGLDHDWGGAEWLTKGQLIDLLLDSNVSNAEVQCQQFLGDRYMRVSPVLPQPAIKLDAWQRRDDLVAFGQKADIAAATAWVANLSHQ